MSRLTAEAISLSFEQRGQRRAILRDLSLGLARASRWWCWVLRAAASRHC